MHRSLDVFRYIHPQCRPLNTTRTLSTFLTRLTTRTKPRNLSPRICPSYRRTRPNSVIPCSISFQNIISSQFSTDVEQQNPPADKYRPSQKKLDLLLKQKIEKLIGVPCSGCGSPFQIKEPESAGFLSPALVDPENRYRPPPKDDINLMIDPASSSMSNDQYEAYLKTLDPRVLQEMGLRDMMKLIDTEKEDGENETNADDKEKKDDVAEEILDKKPKVKNSRLSRIICKRCHSLSHHSSPLANLNVPSTELFPASSPTPAPEHIKMLRESKKSTIVLVVDLVDFPLSIPKHVIEELLTPSPRREHNPYQPPAIIVVGNKFDLMPQGIPKHQMIKNIREYFEKHKLDQNLRAIHVVSARHPQGDEISLLIKSIASTWFKYGKRNVVMVGTENVGKSQLLNAILWESVRWKPGGAEIDRKKFGSDKLERRAKLNKILGGNAEDEEWDAMTGTSTEGSDMAKYKDIYINQGNEKFDAYKTTVSNVPGTTLGSVKVPLRVLKKYLLASYKDYDKSMLVDTPGIRDVDGQLTSWLTVDELSVSMPKSMLKPSSFILDEGRSFFLGGLVRIDCLSVGKGPAPENNLGNERESRVTPSGRMRGSNPLPKLTVFTELPLHITSTERANRFLELTEMGELTILQPPFGSSERIKAFPGLSPAFGGDVEIVNDPLSKKPSARIITESSSAIEGSPENETPQEIVDPFAKLDGRFDTGLAVNLPPRVRQSTTAQIYGQNGICDLVFSGIGWVMVSGKFHGKDQAVRLRVWTPKGQGAGVREPCFFPELASQPIEKTSGGIRQNRKIFSRLSKSLPKKK